MTILPEHSFYWNFYAVGYLINVLTILLVIILLSGMKKRDDASKTILLYFFSTSLGWGAFAFTHVAYFPLAAYYRWISYPIALLVPVICIKLILSFPKIETPKLSKIILSIYLSLSFLAIVVFYLNTIGEKLTFNFSSENWDFDLDAFSGKMALIILFNTASLVILSIYRIITTKEQRISLILFLISFIFVVLIPAYLNFLTRSGILERSLFVVIFSTFGIIGTFILLVTYVNHTKDPTSFMMKITSITMALIMVTMEFVSYYFLKDADSQFDLLRIQESLLDSREIPSDHLKFKIIYDLSSDKFQADGIDINLLPIQKVEFQNTLILESIRTKSKTNKEIISELKNTDTLKFPYFVLIKNQISYVYEKKSPDEKKDILSELDSINKFISYHRKRLEHIPALNFKKSFKEYLNDQKPDFQSAKNTSISILENLNIENLELKDRILNYFTPIYPREARRYLETTDGKHYIFYLILDSKNDKLVEYGYDYLLFREHQNENSQFIVWLVFIILFIVAFGFRYFFYLSLVKPLDSLLEGVKNVNEGNLTGHVTPQVEDEIGFLTKSFNSMVLSISHAQAKLKEYAGQLEQRVQERTHDLMKTLEKVQELKNQQDGDYFLTSLLIKPLNTNKVESEVVEVEFFTSQKKKFQFREWNDEIGGDLCMANTIILKDKKYTLYINADAMGKSLQGAGGALVFGSVFESIVNRNHSSPDSQQIFPEKWIKDAFLELHKVFETFDGSMLVSMVIGLIDDETGLLYSINVEHPWSILLRDGKANFIDDEKTYRKLGTLGADGSIKVFTMQLFPNDTIISGSDGRDDILIKSEDGQDYMNENEKLILSHVEQSNGDLEEIFNLISSAGTLIDDFTLIKIKYGEKILVESSAEENQIFTDVKYLIQAGKKREAIIMLEAALLKSPSFLKLSKLLFRLFLQNNNYKKALSLIEPLIVSYPADLELFFQAAYAEKKIGNYKRACELGESVKLRHPKHLKNILNLFDSYLLNNNQERAKYLLENAIKLDPNNPQVIKRLTILNLSSSSK